MADLHKHDDDNHHHHHHDSIPSQPNQSPTHPHQFHPQNQLHFVTDMFHQPQSQSQLPSRVIDHNPLSPSDRTSSRVIQQNNNHDDGVSNEFDVDFGLGFPVQNSDNPNNCQDDVSFVDHLNRNVVARYESDDSSQCSDDDDDDVDFRPRFFPQSFCNPDCDNESDGSSQCSDDCDGTEEETEIIDFVDGDYDDDDDDEESFHLWDAFHLQDDITPPNPNPNLNANSNSNANANYDFEWEEVDDGIDESERETLSMFFGMEPDDDASVSPVLLTAFEEEPNEEHEHDALQWQVLSNVHDFEPVPYTEDQYEDYNYTEYEMFFGQFGDSDVPASGRPPASKSAVVNLLNVVVSEADVVNNNVVCAVCKDEVVVGEMVTQLPCSHRYHGECILPWLAVRNTCPVCRHELPTDDVEYERRKAERGGQA